MKPKDSIIYLLIVLLAVLGCSKKEENEGIYSVSGYLKSNGAGIENITVDIDGLEQYKTKSNAEGYFIINNVPTGSHALNTQNNNNDGSFIQKSFDILVNADLIFEELLLPNPVLIIPIELDSLNNLATIKWNKSHAEDFREYKLYSHSTSGLDETTGTLEHVTINANDTVKEIQLDNFTERYFRVFVLNDYGQLGGSNIEGINSINRNQLIGGDFENQSLFSEQWTIISGTVNIIDSISFNGTHCLLMQNTITPTPFHSEVSTIEIPIELIADKEYEVSFWYRAKGIGRMDGGDDGHGLYFNYQQHELYFCQTNLAVEYGSVWEGEWIPLGPFKALDDTGWMFYSKVFVPDDDSPARFHIGCEIEIVYFDDLRLKLKE